jgi:hypothetical protein
MGFVDDEQRPYDEVTRTVSAKSTRPCGPLGSSRRDKRRIPTLIFARFPTIAKNYDPATIQYVYKGLDSVQYDAVNPPSVLPLACRALCLIESCAYDDTGDFDPPENPLARTVACECKIESIGDCVNEEDDVWYSEALAQDHRL